MFTLLSCASLLRLGRVVSEGANVFSGAWELCLVKAGKFNRVMTFERFISKLACDGLNVTSEDRKVCWRVEEITILLVDMRAHTDVWCF